MTTPEASGTRKRVFMGAAPSDRGSHKRPDMAESDRRRCRSLSDGLRQMDFSTDQNMNRLYRRKS
jgi:hypothetical protein